MAGVSGRMGEQGGLRTGWLAAFGTEGYDGEPGLMEELGVNFGHIKTKVGSSHVGSYSAYADTSRDIRSTKSALNALTAYNGRQ